MKIKYKYKKLSDTANNVEHILVLNWTSMKAANHAVPHLNNHIIDCYKFKIKDKIQIKKTEKSKSKDLRKDPQAVEETAPLDS